MSQMAYSNFVNDVLTKLAADPGEPVALSAIRRTAIKFCAKSWVWKHFCDPDTILPRIAEYEIDCPANADIAAVIDVSVDGLPIEPKTIEWLNAEYPDWRSRSGNVKFCTQINSENLMLAPVPCAHLPNKLLVTIALHPSLNSTGLPKWIGTQYYSDIVSGAAADLMLMGNKPWTDAKYGQELAAQFESTCNNARTDSVSGLGRAPLRTRSEH